MLGILTLLKSKYVWIALGALTVFLVIKSFFGWLEGIVEHSRLQAAELSVSETLRSQANMNVRQMNAEIELRAAISEVEEMERQKLLDEIDDTRRIRISQVETARKDTRQALRDVDCARAVLPDAVIRLSDRTRTAANQRSTD